MHFASPAVKETVKNHLNKLEDMEKALAKGTYMDVVVHGEGKLFFINGQLVDGKTLAAIIKENMGGQNITVRLLSCSDLKSAQELADHQGVDVIANNGLTRIHADGGITVVSKTGNQTELWYRLKPGKSIDEATEEVFTAYKTTKPDEYVELGNKKVKVVDGDDLETLLKNESFRVIYEPLLDGSHIRRLAKYDVTIAEESALKLFIRDNYYGDFNKALAGDIPMTTEYNTMRKLLENALSKLPKETNVTVFRGAGELESVFAKGLKKNQEFNFQGRFSSSSLEEYVAFDFMRGGKGDVIWEIESKSGANITAINKDEAEVLFKPNVNFKLIDVVPSKTYPNVFVYKIKEL